MSDASNFLFRYDAENVAAVDGHDDVFWEAAEMDEVVELPKGGRERVPMSKGSLNLNI